VCSGFALCLPCILAPLLRDIAVFLSGMPKECDSSLKSSLKRCFSSRMVVFTAGIAHLLEITSSTVEMSHLFPSHLANIKQLKTISWIRPCSQKYLQGLTS